MVTEETKSEVEIGPSKLKFQDFDVQAGETKISGHVLIMENSFYLWAGDKDNEVLNNFCMALPSMYDSQPIATRIMGPVADTTSMSLAQRLSKKFNRPVYVSFNVQADNLSLPRIEKCLYEVLIKYVN